MHDTGTARPAIEARAGSRGTFVGKACADFWLGLIKRAIMHPADQSIQSIAGFATLIKVAFRNPRPP